MLFTHSKMVETEWYRHALAARPRRGRSRTFFLEIRAVPAGELLRIYTIQEN